VAVAAAVAAIAAIGLLIGRRDVWLRVSLFVAGGTMLVVSLVNLASVRSKADDIHVLFGIPTADVQAQIGIGLVLVAFASVGVVGGAIVAHRIDTT
jgi:NADH:ubiquinone oxidoreductase subunit K